MPKCFQERVEEAVGRVPSISVEQAKARAGSRTVFVDPRPPDAIASTTGLIPGALNVRLDSIQAGELPEALADKRAEIITACQGGPMGAVAAHELSKLGYSNVSYLAGGTQAWIDAGMPTYR